MGRLIDADKLFPDVMKVDGLMAISQGQLAHAKTVEAVPKADYETHLKADMVAVLDKIRAEIQATIDEERTGNGNINKGVVIGLQMSLDTIDKYKAKKE